MSKQMRCSPEFRERAVRLVFVHQAEYASQWAAISSIAAKIGCTAETRRKWVRQSEQDQGLREGVVFFRRIVGWRVASSMKTDLPWSRPCGDVAIRRAWSIIVTAAASTYRSATPRSTPREE